MKSQTFLTDPILPLVADASTIINLVATGCASAILSAIPNRIVVVDVVCGELDTGRPRGRKDADRLQELVKEGHLEIVTLNDAAWHHFERLVRGPSIETLDDGEAATIAYALENRGTAVIDEKKATRICSIRYPNLQLLSTFDMLLHSRVRAKLGEDRFRDAVFRALREARMSVFPTHVHDVIQLIGEESATICPSISKGLKVSAKKVSHSAG